MSIIITALALSASAQATPAQAPASQLADHAQHHQMQMGQKGDADGCACCKDMAKGKKMACCEKHDKADGGEHADHSSK